MSKFIKGSIKISLAILLLFILVKNSLLNFNLLTVIFNKPIQLFYVFALILLIVMMSARRWYILNSTQHFGISYRDTFFATYIGLTFNSLLPGSVGGDLIRVNYLFKHLPQRKMVGALSVFADRLMGLSGVFFTLFFIGLLYRSLFQHSVYLSLFFTLCMWLSCVAVLLAAIFMLSNRFRFSKAIKNSLSGKLAELVLILKTYKNSPWVIVEGIFLSIIIQVLLGFIAVVIGLMLEFPVVSELHYTIASLVTQLVSLIPISPGGFGVGEMAFAKTVMQLNPMLPAAYATIYLAFRVINMLFLVPGILFFLKTRQFLLAESEETHLSVG
jgi:uncharacterized protein (TIRG00374 family)